MKKWKKLSSKQVFQHPRLDVYEDDVELPNGFKTKYIHFGEANNAVTAITIRDDGKILLQKEYSYPSNEWLYQFPGGGLAKDETPTVGIKRELSEEANLTGDIIELGWFYPDNRRKKDKMFVFVVANIQEKAGDKDTEEEFIDFWLTPNEIFSLIAKNQIVNYSTLAAWAMYLTKNRI